LVSRKEFYSLETTSPLVITTDIYLDILPPQSLSASKAPADERLRT
jgi:hypothetical protein